jgi:transcriptional regulator with XRE-family HTH domain
MGERIREARSAARMSQKELAGLLGVSYQQVLAGDAQCA